MTNISKDLHESEELHRVFVDNILDLLIKCDLDAKFLYVSPQSFDILGYTPEELIGSSSLDYIYPGDVKKLTDAMNTFKNIGDKVSIELRFIHKGGHHVPVFVKGQIIEVDNEIIYIGIISDISERKKAEQKLRESEEMYREAYIQSNFFKDIISHDINNILQIIKSSSQLYRIYQHESKNFEKLEEVLDTIDNAVFRGAKLISNVQTLSKINDADFPIETTEVCQVLEDSINSIKKECLDKKINIEIKAPSKELHVRANAILLDVFENILNNAVKYNHNQDVKLSVKISKEVELDQRYIKIEFMDNGMGIPDTNKAEIFTKGFKKDSNVRGLGIGLSLVKKAIDSYKGKIWVEDRIKGDYSKGSNFVLLIPEVELS